MVGITRKYFNSGSGLVCELRLVPLGTLIGDIQANQMF